MTHPTRPVRLNGREAPIDVELIPLIEELWKLGIETSASCQGSGSSEGDDEEDRESWGYIQFPDVEDFRRFLDLFANTELSSRRFKSDEGYRRSTSLTWECFIGVKRNGAGDTNTASDLVKVVARVGFPTSDIPSMTEIVRRVRPALVSAELRKTYLKTRLTIEMEPGRWVDVHSVLDRLGLPAFVITAWNPFSEALTEEENHARNLELRRTLSELGTSVRPAIGASPSGDWSEESFLIEGTEEGTAIDLGHRFGQHAVFEVTSAELRVLACDGPWSEIRRWDSTST